MSANQPAKLGSRLLAILYDILIVFLIIVITIIVIQFIVGQGKEIPADHIIHTILKNFWILLSFLYFGYFWTKRGQTPGMKVWKVKVINPNGGLISWLQALKRYVAALFGIGLLFVIFNRDRLALQDKISGTSLIRVNQ